MAFPILGANTESAAYEISNSLRFNDDDSAYLSRTPSSASNRKTWTWSGWIKRSNISLNMILFSADNTVGHGIYLAPDDKLYLTKSGVGNYGIDAQLRDVSAWYHIVVAVDTTQTGMSNIVKFYINGVQRTASGTTLYSTNDDTNINNNSVHNIGRFSKNSSFYYDGYLSEVNFVDGSQLTPSSFGETNNNGVWVPKKYTGSYGTNGFFLEFKQTGTSANSSGIGADTSGNDHHFTPSNLAATDITVDTPTNNFATLNSIAPVGSYAEGNLRYTTSTTDGEWSTSTISISTNAKWYCEVKAISKTAGAGIYYQVGVTKGNASDFTYRALYRSDGAIYVGGSNTATFSSYTDNDIISIAYDSSNRNVTFYKNGNSEGTVTAPSLPSTSDDYFFGASSLSGGNTFITEWNFGNAPFSISSGNSDANGYGNFEYAVPSGYYSLNTKNLAEYG